jgi:hypothetical protein
MIPRPACIEGITSSSALPHRHARYFTLQLAEGYLTRPLFRQIVARIEQVVFGGTGDQVRSEQAWGLTLSSTLATLSSATANFLSPFAFQWCLGSMASVTALRPTPCTVAVERCSVTRFSFTVDFDALLGPTA